MVRNSKKCIYKTEIYEEGGHWYGTTYLTVATHKNSAIKNFRSIIDERKKIKHIKFTREGSDLEDHFKEMCSYVEKLKFMEPKKGLFFYKEEGDIGLVLSKNEVVSLLDENEIPETIIKYPQFVNINTKYRIDINRRKSLKNISDEEKSRFVSFLKREEMGEPHCLANRLKESYEGRRRIQDKFHASEDLIIPYFDFFSQTIEFDLQTGYRTILTYSSRKILNKLKEDMEWVFSTVNLFEKLDR